MSEAATPTVESLRRTGAARKTVHAWMWGAIYGGFLSGVGTFALGTFVIEDLIDNSHIDNAETYGWAAGLVALVGLGALGSHFMYGRAHKNLINVINAEYKKLGI